jgi:4-amino-4-deoxy-L-arabinose transferase-like glycosyltransferase
MSMRTYVLGVGVAAIASMLLRLRFVFAPLSDDEGGFVAVARSWAHGATLYRDVWVDRPQGLLALFRLSDMVSHGNEQSVRVMALLLGAIMVVAGAEIGRRLHSRRAGVLAAALVAASSSAALISGFAANGELLSGTFSALAVAVGAAVIVGRLSIRWFLVAGALGALAVSIKQSGVDGFGALFAWLLLAAAFAFGGERRRHLLGIAALVGGFVAMASPFILHGAVTGWSRWRYAFSGYRVDSRSALRGADWGRFFETWSHARVVFLPMVFAAMLAVAFAIVRARLTQHPEPRWTSPLWLLPLWLVTASVTFASGGQFWHHYWVVFAAPIAVATAVAVASWPSSVGVAALGTVAILPAVATTIEIARLPRDEIPLVNETKVEEVGHWFAGEHRPGETLYVFCNKPNAYAQADADPPFPYLWIDGVTQVPGARELLAGLLTDPARAPTFVARFQDEATCGLEQGLLNELYKPFTAIRGVPIWVRNDRVVASPTSLLVVEGSD